MKEIEWMIRFNEEFTIEEVNFFKELIEKIVRDYCSGTPVVLNAELNESTILYNKVIRNLIEIRIEYEKLLSILREKPEVSLTIETKNLH